MPTAGKAAVERILSSRPVDASFSWATRSRLRVLAYHDVPDAAAFARHVEVLADQWNPVSGQRVSEWIHEGRPLPDRPVWVTFDDGRRAVVERALPILQRADLPATMFICPGLLPAGSVYWQSVVMAALRDESYTLDGHEYRDRGLVIAMKQLPDTRRREIVAELGSRLEGRPPLPGDTVSSAQVAQWVDAGLEVGSHTWDHPCLDMCSAEEQERQVRTAHEALHELLGDPPTLFAYPNGDWTSTTEAVLVDAGYRLAPLFDHRLVSRRPHAMRLSRLRIDSDAPPDRLCAVLSGAHSTAFGVVEPLRRARGRM